VWYNPTKENEIQLVAVSHSQEKKKKGGDSGNAKAKS
jgi:hypothetical protein